MRKDCFTHEDRFAASSSKEVFAVVVVMVAAFSGIVYFLGYSMKAALL